MFLISPVALIGSLWLTSPPFLCLRTFGPATSFFDFLFFPLVFFLFSLPPDVEEGSANQSTPSWEAGSSLESAQPQWPRPSLNSSALLFPRIWRWDEEKEKKKRKLLHLQAFFHQCSGKVQRWKKKEWKKEKPPTLVCAHFPQECVYVNGSNRSRASAKSRFCLMRASLWGINDADQQRRQTEEAISSDGWKLLI